ncbi:DUF262 domain-containing protein [Methylophaga thalassica]|nr:DUF262 domain-containing protein [Methylophaga thalassica]
MKNKSVSIRKAVGYLNNEEQDGGFWLPNIQRPFVWKEEQIEKLFDSLMREYPISTLLVWRTQSAIKRRRFIDLYKDGVKLSNYHVPEDKKTKMLVLDGQQRLQSLFIALKGSYNKKELYFHILSGGQKNPEEMRYRFQFMEPEKASFPWVNFKEIVFSNRVMPSQLADHIITTSSATASDESHRIMEENIWRAHNVFVNQEAVNYQELDSIDNPDAYSEDDVVEIFIRANSGGTKLGKSDLLFSLLTASWEDADEAMEDLISELNATGYEFSRDFILKTCLVLLDKGAAYDVRKFREETTKSQIIERWEDISNAIKAVRDYLYGKTYIKSDHALPSYLGLIPLIYLRYKYPEKWAKNRHVDAYLFRTLLCGAFSGRPDNLIDKCIKRINKDEDMIAESMFDVIHNDGRNMDVSDESILHSSYGSKNIHLLFNLWYREFDYNPSYQGNSPEVDHIFPQSMLRSQKTEVPETGKWVMRYQAGARDQIANCMLLTSDENGFQNKNDTLPEEWFSDKPRHYLDLHLIPDNPELWKLENYELFIEARKQLILKKFRPILENLGVVTSERYIPDAVSDRTTPAPVERIVAPSADATEMVESDDSEVVATRAIQPVPEPLQHDTSVGEVADAEQLLGNVFTLITEPTKYVAGYRAPNGLELALMRTTKSLTVWTEQVDGYDAIGLVPEKNYSSLEPRNSNLNRKNTPKLRLGFPAMVWKLESVDELMDLINWYSNAESQVLI